MSADRELLELAAKAAGMDYLIWTPGAAPIVPAEHRADPNRIAWSPLTDDGDALRLAVKLGIQVTPGTYLTQDAVAYVPGSQEVKEHVHYQQDMLTATHRAIVRAAAEIGRSMP